jgi:hypothetical protein
MLLILIKSLIVAILLSVIILSIIKLSIVILRAAWVPDMFHNFYLVKNHKIAKNSAATKARETINTDLEFFEI